MRQNYEVKDSYQENKEAIIDNLNASDFGDFVFDFENGIYSYLVDLAKYIHDCESYDEVPFDFYNHLNKVLNSYCDEKIEQAIEQAPTDCCSCSFYQKEIDYFGMDENNKKADWICTIENMGNCPGVKEFLKRGEKNVCRNR